MVMQGRKGRKAEGDPASAAAGTLPTGRRAVEALGGVPGVAGCSAKHAPAAGRVDACCGGAPGRDCPAGLFLLQPGGQHARQAPSSQRGSPLLPFLGRGVWRAGRCGKLGAGDSGGADGGEEARRAEAVASGALQLATVLCRALGADTCLVSAKFFDCLQAIGQLLLSPSRGGRCSFSALSVTRFLDVMARCKLPCQERRTGLSLAENGVWGLRVSRSL